MHVTHHIPKIEAQRPCPDRKKVRARLALRRGPINVQQLQAGSIRRVLSTMQAPEARAKNRVDASSTERQFFRHVLYSDVLCWTVFSFFNQSSFVTEDWVTKSKQSKQLFFQCSRLPAQVVSHCGGAEWFGSKGVGLGSIDVHSWVKGVSNLAMLWLSQMSCSRKCGRTSSSHWPFSCCLALSVEIAGLRGLIVFQTGAS